ncbi:MAG: hypothetical protein ACYTKD_14925 [Planctomycetota bacterium]
MKWWLGPAIAAGGVLLMRWTGWSAMAVLVTFAAFVSLLAAGSLRAVGFVLGRATDLEGFDEEAVEGTKGAEEGTNDEPARGKRTSSRRAQMTMNIERIPERTGLALEFALYFSGVAAALIAFHAHAAAAGWAGAAAGLAAARRLNRWPRLVPAVFAIAAAPAAAGALLWVPAPKELPVDPTTVAVLVMTAGAGASGASIMAMRWRFSKRLSLPVAMALAVSGLSWFFVQGEQFLGREDQAMLVAVGVGVGGVVALAGWGLRAIDGPAAGVVFFLTSRVYSFVDWYGFVPFIAATILGWRPLAVKRKAAGAKRSMHGAAYELLVGIVPFALAGGYFMSFNPESFLVRFHWILLIAYAAYCASASAASVSSMLEARPRARVIAAAGVCVGLPAFVALVWDESYGPRAIAAAVTGALLAWAGGEALRKMEEWRELPSPVRRAALGCMGAVVAITIAAAAGYGASPA